MNFNGEQVVDDLGEAGQTAGGNGVGLEKPGEAHGKKGGAQRNDQEGEGVLLHS